jgi:hypothetical protein
MLCKSCSSSHTEHSKIGFANFGFSYDFILNLQVAAKNTQRGKNYFAHRPLKQIKDHSYALGSQLHPCREKLPSNWVPGSSRWRSSPESGKTGGGAGQGGGGYRLGAHYGHISGRSCGGGSTGEQVRRRRPVMAAGTPTPASWRVGQGKKRRWGCSTTLWAPV